MLANKHEDDLRINHSFFFFNSLLGRAAITTLLCYCTNSNSKGAECSRTVQTEAVCVCDTYNYDRLVSSSDGSLHSEAAVPDISVGRESHRWRKATSHKDSSNKIEKKQQKKTGSTVHSPENPSKVDADAVVFAGENHLRAGRHRSDGSCPRMHRCKRRGQSWGQDAWVDSSRK